MRLYVPHDQRRANPEPVVTRDLVPVFAGLAGWAVALIVILLVLPAPFQGVDDRWFWTAVSGLGGGLVLLVVAWRHDRKVDG